MDGMDPKQLQDLLAQIGGGAGDAPKAKGTVEIKAGVMTYDTTTHQCEADRRKGLIIVKKDPQGFYNFEFQDASTKQVIEGPEMIFEGDVTFAKVKQTEDRVYVMTFKDSKRRRFYWFQVSSFE